MGKPVVATRLPMVEHTFPGGSVMTYDSGDPSALARAIEAIVDDPIAREAAIVRAAAIVRDAAWEREATGYLGLIDRLVDGAS